MGKEGTFRPAATNRVGVRDEVSILNREPFAPEFGWLSRAPVADFERFSSSYVAYMTDFPAETRTVELIAHARVALVELVVSAARGMDLSLTRTISGN